MESKEWMRNLGFTDYEAKAYLSLLKEPSVTGYALAKNSGVPRSKIYEVLEGLLTRGDVLVSQGNPPLYRALPIKEMITARKTAAEQNFNLAERELEKMQNETSEDDGIWNIRGRDAIIGRVRGCIDSAKQRVLLEIWAEDFPDIYSSLAQAASRGVVIDIVGYGEIDAPYANVYPHDMSEKITSEYGGRWIVFSADDRQVVAGTVSLGEENRAAWTMHPGLVMPITEVIIHDLYIAEMLKTHRTVLEETYGKDLIRLREKFLIGQDAIKHYIYRGE